MKNSDYLFTFDRGYLSEQLGRHGIEMPDLDEFLVSRCKDQQQGMERAVTLQATAWRGGRPVAELLDAFERANVPRFAAEMRVGE